jgi:hypothetical protein
VYVHEKYSKKYCWKYKQIYCQIYCWKYVHILLDVYACIFDRNTYIYLHILTYVPPITVSVYACMNWIYMHILLQSR